MSPTGVGHGPVLDIVNASRDLLSGFVVNLSSLSGSVGDAGMMALSPKRDRTVVVSPSDGKLAIVNNATESLTGIVTLPGTTQSVFVWTDDTTAFAAVPSAGVTGASPGAVVRVDITSGSITAAIPVPVARFIAPSPNGDQILAFSDNSNLVSVIAPSLVGVGPQTPTQPCSSTPAAVCTVSDPSLDHPIGAVFNSTGTTAYIISCGPECGGSAAAISVLNLGGGSTAPSFTGQVALIPGGATTALLQGSTLYVAGTPPAPQNSCGTLPQNLAVLAPTCGQLTLINTTTMTVTTSVQISDGTHSLMAIGANAQLFVGSINCTNAASICLNIVDTSSGSVAESNVHPTTDGGNVTGIAPIPNRSVVYVCVGGRLRVYDTTTDTLEVIPTPGQPDVVGEAVDVKVVDF